MTTNRLLSSLLGIAVSLLLLPSVIASPASGRRFSYKKENGEAVSVILRGDEFGHWYEDESGNTYILSHEGRLNRIEKQQILSKRSTEASISNVTRHSASSGYQQGSLSTETVFTVVFAAFADLPFLDGTVDFFKAFLGEGDPSVLNTSWSTLPEGENVFTYWGELLDGKSFRIIPTVISLSRERSYYGSNEISQDRYASSIRTEVISIMNQLSYGYNSDTNLIIIFSGQGEAGSGDPYAIWPCCYNIGWMPNAGNTLYTCELSSSGHPDIGTLMHEFGHAMGLPDLYDTDYGKNGYAGNLPDSHSIMCSGNYNGFGMCPPTLSAVERMILLGEEAMLSKGQIVQINTDSVNTILPVSEGVLYYTYNPLRPEEWFIAEYRPKESRGRKTWDYYCSTNDMVYYHLDRRSDYCLTGDYLTARQRFSSLHGINMWKDHPLFSQVPHNQISTGNIELWPDSEGKSLLLGYSILNVKTDSYAANASVTLIGRPEPGKVNIVIVVKTISGGTVDPSTIYTNAPGAENINGVYYVQPPVNTASLSGQYVFWRNDLQCTEVSVRGITGTCPCYSVSLGRKPLFFPLHMTWTQTNNEKAISIDAAGEGALYATVEAKEGSFGLKAKGLRFDTDFFQDENAAAVSVICSDADGQRIALCSKAPVSDGKVTFTTPAILPEKCRLLICISSRSGAPLAVENFLTGQSIQANKHDMKVFSEGEVNNCDFAAQLPVSILLEKAEEGDITVSSLKQFN